MKTQFTYCMSDNDNKDNLTATMQSKIWLSSPHMGGSEKLFVGEAFDTNWIAPLGPNVDGFENDIANYLGHGCHAAALSSGTSAIHLGLIILGVQKGDEVICQSMTFSASANPIIYIGANPVFVDSEPDTWNMSPLLMEEAIQERLRKGGKPKAIIVVHLYGMPAKMGQIMEVARRYDIPVLEDAAEALGSSIGNQKCGTFGDIGVLSFNGNKIITTSGGGALISKNVKWVEKARFLATQARDPAPHYQHSQIGYNYRLSNVCAGIGRGQMLVLEERIEQRRRNFDYYKKSLSKENGISFLDEPNNFLSNRWLTTILFNDQSTGAGTREKIRLALENKNIESRPLWKPMHRQPVFRDAPYYGGTLAETLFNTGLCLPSGSNLSTGNLKLVVDYIKEFMSSD
jgi:dTDP-4-amino-4,6-dideoxygalactose transaminase